MHLVTYIIAVALLIASPGPIITLVIKASKNGVKSAIPTILGASLASLVLLLCTFVGLFFSIKHNVVILDLIKVFGGIYLLWLGYHCYKCRLDGIVANKKSYSRGTFKTFLLGVSNPKDIIFLVSFVAGFIDKQGGFWGQAGVLTLLWLLIDLLIMLLYAEFSKKLFKYRYATIILNWLPILTMPTIGILAIHSALNNIFGH